MQPQVVNLTPSELKAIEEHKYFLSCERGAEAPIEDAIADFLRRFAEEWRRQKARRDILDQRSEIEKHRYLRSQELGRDVGSSAAALEWCEKYASIWRAERESLERNGFRRRSMTVLNPRCLHLRPWSAITLAVAGFDCDVYVHRDGMPYWNFTLEGRPFMNVKSVVNLLSMGIALSDRLEFLAMGAQAEPALDTLVELLGQQPVPEPATEPAPEPAPESRA
jgi:phosphotransferase system HPr (HPr) family protein